MASFRVVTFGCQMNSHDSARMREGLIRAGYVEATAPESADVVVLNTCSVREKAEHKLRSEVGRLAMLKRDRPELVLGIAGCVAQQEGERLLRDMPDVDLVIGPDNIEELPALVREAEHGGPPRVRTVFDTDAPRFLSADPGAASPGAAAFVTIMKGCDERCSFCIVPTTRGPERYRPSSEILDEVAALVGSGVKELTLLGQTVNSYRDPAARLPVAAGIGIPLASSAASRRTESESEFPALLRSIAARVPGLARLRYTSPHPRHLTSALVEAHREIPMLPRHVHMPVQSGSDAVLKRMIRRYTAEEYVERITALRGAVPGLSVSTDIIVGFPGETEADFEATLALVERVGFISVFGFKYSRRPSTPALRLHDDVTEVEKTRRLAALFEHSEALRSRHLESLVGTEQLVLCEGRNKQGQFTGRAERNEIVHFAARGEMTGRLARVRVVCAFKHSLAAELVDTEQRLPYPPLRAERRMALPVL